MKNLFILALALVFMLSFSACKDNGNTDGPEVGVVSSDPPAEEIEDVALTLWGGEAEQAMLRVMADAFIEENRGKANLTVNIGIEHEPNYAILSDISAAADVFVFQSGHFAELYGVGALREITLNTQNVVSANTGGSITAASRDGRLYAYPMSTDSGYFMLYDASYFSADDILSFEKMLDVAAGAGKKMAMDFSSGRYTYAFFKGAGLEAGICPDTGTSYCDWNTGAGPAVAESMLEIASHPGFASMADVQFADGIRDGSVIAGISGWHHSGVAVEAWGVNYSAAKLPSFNLGGNQTQMGSFADFTLIGVSAFSQNSDWAMLLGEWLTNYENQVLRFEEHKRSPTNIQAAVHPAVLSSPELSAVAAQSRYAPPQLFSDSFWPYAGTLGETIAKGNPNGTDIQTLLDDAAAGIAGGG
jgi:arabinogalactan oligomer/maltooligosaccharide transport system substrate-binding protein